jgi:hydrogenase nickel incorporation protein HypA/HybF
MHESALMALLIRQVEGVAQLHGARKVVGVTLTLGALAPVTPGHLRDHFGLAARGTVAEDAVLTIEVGSDPGDPQAQRILLTSVEIEDAASTVKGGPLC